MSSKRKSIQLAGGGPVREDNKKDLVRKPATSSSHHGLEFRTAVKEAIPSPIRKRKSAVSKSFDEES
jgi:hypothetical protein